MQDYFEEEKKKRADEIEKKMKNSDEYKKGTVDEKRRIDDISRVWEDELKNTRTVTDVNND